MGGGQGVQGGQRSPQNIQQQPVFGYPQQPQAALQQPQPNVTDFIRAGQQAPQQGKGMRRFMNRHIDPRERAAFQLMSIPGQRQARRDLRQDMRNTRRDSRRMRRRGFAAGGSAFYDPLQGNASSQSNTSPNTFGNSSNPLQSPFNATNLGPWGQGLTPPTSGLVVPQTGPFILGAGAQPGTPPVQPPPRPQTWEHSTMIPDYNQSGETNVTDFITHGQAGRPVPNYANAAPWHQGGIWQVPDADDSGQTNVEDFIRYAYDQQNPWVDGIDPGGPEGPAAPTPQAPRPSGGTVADFIRRGQQPQAPVNVTDFIRAGQRSAWASPAQLPMRGGGLVRRGFAAGGQAFYDPLQNQSAFDAYKSARPSPNTFGNAANPLQSPFNATNLGPWAPQAPAQPSSPLRSPFNVTNLGPWGQGLAPRPSFVYPSPPSGQPVHTGVGHYGPSLVDDMNAARSWSGSYENPEYVDRMNRLATSRLVGAPVSSPAFHSGAYRDVNFSGETNKGDFILSGQRTQFPQGPHYTSEYTSP